MPGPWRGLGAGLAWPWPGLALARPGPGPAWPCPCFRTILGPCPAPHRKISLSGPIPKIVRMAHVYAYADVYADAYADAYANAYADALWCEALSFVFLPLLWPGVGAIMKN